VCCSEQDGKIEGTGTFYYEEDKRKYVGHFRNGLKHGQGEYYFPNGSRCVACSIFYAPFAMLRAA
jgi:antitoxin component YwqK of YwqJK toxin-antitoxin module